MPSPRDYQAVMDAYISSVLDGSQLVCKTVRMTIDRHLADMKRNASEPDYPFYYSNAGAKVCRLLERVNPSKWPTPIVLGPWQVCMIMMLYGWKRKEDDTRRFRIAFIMLPRKTGKSALCSGFSLNALVADGERGAEVYSLALVEDQARRVFDEAVKMRDSTAFLKDITSKEGTQPCRKLHHHASGSEFKPLSRDKDAIQGTNPSFACCDEVHVWKGRGAWDDIRYGMEARKQPLLIAITTAPTADDTTSICNTLLEYSYKVLEGVIPDDAFFCWVTSLDPDDQWDDESTWIKACPNLGVTVKMSSMRQMALEAKNDAASLNAFKRYSLNIRVDAIDQPIPTADWNECSRAPKLVNDMRVSQLLRAHTLRWMQGRICFGALDLAIIDDTSALALMFPPMFPGEKWRVLMHYWIPNENITRRVERDRVPYDMWRDNGFLYTTPGKTTDFEWIADRVIELGKLFDMRELAYDPALATGFVKVLLTKGFVKDKLIKFAQTAMNYAAPCGDFTRTVSRKEIKHDGDPVLRWHITNLRFSKGHTGLIMPDKERSIEKIDGAAAAIMAYGRGTHPDNAKLLKPKPKVTVL